MYVFLRFLGFFSKSKKHDFLRFFELLHTFSRTVCNTTLRRFVYDQGSADAIGRKVTVFEYMSLSWVLGKAGLKRDLTEAVKRQKLS